MKFVIVIFVLILLVSCKKENDSYCVANTEIEYFLTDTIQFIDTVTVYDLIPIYDTIPIYIEREKRTPKIHNFFDVSFYMAHAFGRIDGYDYTNSKEAFEQNYLAGYRIFEVDVELTTDGVPVCMHDISSFNSMTGFAGETTILYEDFLSRKIYEKYTLVSADFIIEMLIKYDDIYFDLDLVYDAPISLDYIVNNPLLNELSTSERVKLLKRLIIELYHIEELEAIRDIFEFKNIALNSYFITKDRNAQIDLFIENDLDILVEHYNNLDSTIVKFYNDNGINVVAWTVDDTDMADSLSKWGVKNIYTNILFFYGNEYTIQ